MVYRIIVSFPYNCTYAAKKVMMLCHDKPFLLVTLRLRGIFPLAIAGEKFLSLFVIASAFRQDISYNSYFFKVKIKSGMQ
jgi:hypothetical protein